MRFIIAIVFLLVNTVLVAQVGIHTENPKTTLDIAAEPLNTSLADGIKPPSLTGDELFAKNALYTAQLQGTIVFVSAPASSINQVGKTLNINSVGFYFFDGSSWVKLISDKNKLSDWNYLVKNWSVIPTENTVIAGGTVWDYTLNGVTRYRFVPDTYNPTQDAFYETFDGVTLSNQITTRG